jgi:hypothetical protein
VGVDSVVVQHGDALELIARVLGCFDAADDDHETCAHALPILVLDPVLAPVLAPGVVHSLLVLASGIDDGTMCFPMADKNFARECAHVKKFKSA